MAKPDPADEVPELPPAPSPLGGAADLFTKLETFLLQKGGWIGALGVTMFFVFDGIENFRMHNWNGLLHDLAWESIALSLLAIGLRGRRNTTMSAQGFGEIKVAIAGPTVASADPAINAVEKQVTASGSYPAAKGVKP